MEYDILEVECRACEDGWQSVVVSTFDTGQEQWYPDYRPVPCGVCNGTGSIQERVVLDEEAA